jgi:hypothetical protein
MWFGNKGREGKGGREGWKTQQNAPRPHFIRPIPPPQLLPQPLVESQRRRFRGTVIHIRGPDDEARHAGQRHDVPVVPLDHMRQELLDQQEMRDVVDVKGRADLRFGLFENGFAVPDSRIVDQHRRVPDVSADGASDGGDVGGGGHVGFVEGDVRLPFGLGVCRRWGFQVEYNDFDASLCELACDQSSIPLDPPVIRTVSRDQSQVWSDVQLFRLRRESSLFSL